MTTNTPKNSQNVVYAAIKTRRIYVDFWCLRRIKLELRLNDLLNFITHLGVVYRQMQYYVNSTDFERLTLEDFAKTVISHGSDSVGNLVERIHGFIAPADAGGLTDTGILGLLTETLEVKRDQRSSGNKDGRLMDCA